MKYFKDVLRKFRANLSYFFDKKEIRYTKKDLININKIYKIACLINKDINNKLNTHQIFSDKILKLIIQKNLLNFLQRGFIQQMFFIHNRLFIIFELLELFNNRKWYYWKKLIKEDGIGNPVRFFLYPYSSGNKIHQTYHLKKFYDFSKFDLRNLNNVVEFGGGYGNMAKIFKKKINPKLNYIIFDTKEVSLLQYYYLKKSNVKVTINKFKKKNVSLISNLNLFESTINNFNINDKTLFIANWSLSEVPLAFRKKLNFLINKLDYQIISYQNNFEKIDNTKYFEKVMKINQKKNRFSSIKKMKSKSNNYYLFSCSKAK
jgi:hypothetical protein